MATPNQCISNANPKIQVFNQPHIKVMHKVLSNFMLLHMFSSLLVSIKTRKQGQFKRRCKILNIQHLCSIAPTAKKLWPSWFVAPIQRHTHSQSPSPFLFLELLYMHHRIYHTCMHAKPHKNYLQAKLTSRTHFLIPTLTTNVLTMCSKLSVNGMLINH